MKKQKLSLKEIIFRRCRKNGVSVARIKCISDYLEKIIFELHPFLDKNFVARLVDDQEFENRMSELYFISALRNNHLTLFHKSNAGLDIWINEISGWGEFVCAHNTEKMERENVIGKVRSVNNDETLLRITSILKDKSDKIKEDVKKGRIRENESIILFISTRLLRDPYPMNPEGDVSSFVRALFPLSEPFFTVNVNTKESRMGRKYQLGIPKNGTVIKNDFFLSKENELISAVVFSYSSIYHDFFYPASSSKNGDDFIVVHNPLAKNPIPHRLFNCFQEYVCEYEEGVSFTIRDILTKESDPQID